jgi:hypothetical protein
MKVKLTVFLIILVVSCLLFANQPDIKAQGTQNIINIPLTFHNYTLILNDPNGSFCVYDGADGSTTSANPTQTNLISEIPGQQTVYGMSFSYWSADIIWAVKLPIDLHVKGQVNIRAFISSNFKISGFFSGGGYGMGLVDIDQNNNEVTQFITQAPYTQGGNPFTTSPTQYSVNTNVDYTFKAGHSIGFAVGLGATTQGFTATVYFDSPSSNSGATLPIEETLQCQSFTANGQNIAIVSDSAISGCQFNSAANTIQFQAELIKYTAGYCNVSIPKALLQSPFTVSSAQQAISSTLTANATHYQIYFTHTRNSNPIQITGAASSTPTAKPTPSPTASTAPTGTASSSTPPTQTYPTATSQATSTPPAIPEYQFTTILALFAVTGILIMLTASYWRTRLARGIFLN